MENIEAYSAEWYASRVGVFTGSCLYSLICTPKETPRSYIILKATEELTGKSEESDYENEYMADGTINEPLAINSFAHKTKYTVEPISYWIKHSTLNFGATTDRVAFDLDGNKVILEVKAPKATTHVRRCLIKDVEMLKKKEPKIYWQIVSGCLVHDTTKGGFIDYNDKVNPVCGLFILLFDIPLADINTATEAIEKAETERREIIRILTGETEPIILKKLFA